MILLVNTTPLVGLIVYFVLLFMVLAYPVIKYYISIASLIVIWSLNSLIPPKNTYLMVIFHHTRLGDIYHCFKALLKQALTLTPHTLNDQRMVDTADCGIGVLLDPPVTDDQVVVFTTNLIELGSSYTSLPPCSSVPRNSYG